MRVTVKQPPEFVIQVTDMRNNKPVIGPLPYYDRFGGKCIAAWPNKKHNEITLVLSFASVSKKIYPSKKASYEVWVGCDIETGVTTHSKLTKYFNSQCYALHYARLTIK